MRPILPTIAALVLGLCFTSVYAAGESVDSIQTACYRQNAPGTYSACTGPLQGTFVSLDDCMNTNSSRGSCGSLVSGCMDAVTVICYQLVHGKCAAVGFDPAQIAGCEKYGTYKGVESGTSTFVRGTPSASVVDATANSATSTGARATSSGAGTQRPSDAEVSSDVNACTSALNQASQCCNRPASCSQSSEPAQVPNPNSGLSAQCQQMQAAALENARANNAAAGACNTRSNNCKTTCSPLVSKYTSLASSSSEYQTALQQIQNAQRTCEGFATIVKRLGDQAVASAGSSGAGYQCSAATAAGPSSMFPGSSDSSSDSSSYAQEIDPSGCMTNPNSLACQGMKPPALESTPSGAAFSDSSSKAKPEFNVDPMTGADAGPVFGANGQPAGPNKANVVANNAGGSIPGGAGASPASLGAAAKGRGSPGSPGYTTDIMQGDRSGGYTQAATQAGQDDGLNDGRGGSGRAAGRGLASVSGMDLKRYLPGGALDPNRRLGGLAGGRQILGRFDDMWKNISNRYTEKCKLGVLVDCQ